MNSTIEKVSVPAFLVLAILISSCVSPEDDYESEKLDTLAHIAIRLTDGPGNYKSVIIDIKDVQIHRGGAEGEWKSLDVQTGKYDLLKLTNGIDTLLGIADLPQGNISQIRLILGDDNSVTLKDGKTAKLETPSAMQSGLKVKVDMALMAGTEYNIILDFDVSRSIVKTGGGRYKLKPVIRSIVETLGAGLGGPGGPGSGPGTGAGGNAAFGGINGTIAPAASNPAIHAILGTDTVSTMVDVNGRFLIGGLQGGAYRLVIVPIDGYLQEELNDVLVIEGDTTDIGTIAIGHL